MSAVAAMIIGAQNSRLKRLRRLSSRARIRRQDRAFVIEGPVLVADALRTDLHIEEIFVGTGVDLLDRRLVPAETPILEVDPDVLSAALDAVNPRPVAAVVSAPQWSLDQLRPHRILPVAVELRDPGNLGSLIRSIEGSGAAGLVVAGETVDYLSPKVVRSSAGSVLRVPIVQFDDLEVAVDAIRSAGWTPLTTVVDPQAPPHDSFDLETAAVLLGNEPHGLGESASTLGDARCTIPLAPAVESLNVAAAGAVLCFEAARQRRERKFGGRPTPNQPGL